MGSEKVTSPAASTAEPTDAQNEFFEKQEGAFFRRVDLNAFWTTFAISFAAYFYTIAPTVTLEDSGELAVGSDYLGVPHPPGYPIWTLVTWLFQWVFHWVKYFGTPDSNWMILWKSVLRLFGQYDGVAHPNPAWSVGFCSAFFGALACGMQAMLVSRAGLDMLRSFKRAMPRSRSAACCSCTAGWDARRTPARCSRCGSSSASA